MKNKEIEELLNDLKSVYELNKPLTDKYKEDCMRFIINTKEAELLLSYIEQLEKENKILRENAEHNDKVVDKVNWENQQLKKQKDDVVEYIKGLDGDYDLELANCVKYKIFRMLGEKDVED